MKIINKRDTTVKFSEIKKGEVFRDATGVYMKIENVTAKEDTYNTVNLTNGSVCSYLPSAEFLILERAYLTID